jgi:hypothetical protein
MMMVLSWTLEPCGFIGRCQQFGETCYAVCIFRTEVTELGSGRLRKRGLSERMNMGKRIQTIREPLIWWAR